MLSRRSDLPLHGDALSRYLPWLIAFMVYLAMMALAGVLLLERLAERWEEGVSATLTVQIPPTESGEEDARRVASALDVLTGLPEVAHAETISEGQLAALLEPWLGASNAIEDLPLPQLIDVRLKPGAGLDSQRLSRQLEVVAPGAVVDDHSVWLERLVRLIHSVEVLATAILLLICLATVATVVFTTRTGLAIHREEIEVLHFIGAQSGYIARQFASRALTLGLRGGLIGLVLAAPTLVGIGFLSRRRFEQEIKDLLAIRKPDNLIVNPGSNEILLNEGKMSLIVFGNENRDISCHFLHPF